MRNKKIAVIDDEKHITKLLTIELKSEGYDVVTASNGEEGLELIRAESPDLILLDLMMPKMDGFEVLEVMRADEQLRNIPVLLLTARNSSDDIQRGLELGVEDYIEKPFYAELLMKRIKRVLS